MKQMKQIKNQVNSDHSCPLKRGKNTQSELTFGYKY